MNHMAPIRRALRRRGQSVEAFVSSLPEGTITFQAVYRVLKGQVGVTPKVALMFEKHLGIDGMELGLQSWKHRYGLLKREKGDS